MACSGRSSIKFIFHLPTTHDPGPSSCDLQSFVYTFDQRDQCLTVIWSQASISLAQLHLISLLAAANLLNSPLQIFTTSSISTPFEETRYLSDLPPTTDVNPDLTLGLVVGVVRN